MPKKNPPPNEKKKMSSLALFPNAMDRVDDLLYIGCRAVAPQCAALGFTHRVQLSAAAAAAAPAPPEDESDTNPPLLYIQLEDDEEASLEDAIFVFVQFMRQRNSRTDRVFLHCDAGVSRSGSLALVYLVVFRDMSLSEARSHMLQCRPCVKPNRGFMAQLEQFEKEHRRHHQKSVLVS